MELKADRFERQLASEPLRPIYLIAGGETLLVQEAADAIRASARAQGFTERTVHTVAGAHPRAVATASSNGRRCRYHHIHRPLDVSDSNRDREYPD